VIFGADNTHADPASSVALDNLSDLHVGSALLRRGLPRFLPLDDFLRAQLGDAGEAM
jgi:hypothetical protein